jgi:FKBP-type peptidyl-prolyl cis-trans isomerase
MPRIPFALLITAASCAALVACASANNDPVPDQSFAAGSDPSAAASASQAAPITAGPISTAPAGTSASVDVPVVTDGTDLTKEPKVAAGTGAAPTILTIRDLVTGTGATVSGTSTVNVKYVGTLYSNGTSFDASWGKAGTSPADQATFSLGGVIPGFAQGLLGMKVGGRREIVIPSALAYGANATSTIPADSTLVFVVDMINTTG